MTDIVYVLGRGSRYHNEEIRYSARSVWKFGKNLGRLVLVGEWPVFLQPWRHIEKADTLRCKDANIANGIRLACHDPEITDPFLFMCDDYFMLQSFDADTVPARYGRVTFSSVNEAYQRSLQGSLRILAREGIKDPKFFDIHVPILIHKECMQEVFSHFDWRNEWYAVKTIYANLCPQLKILEASNIKVWTMEDGLDPLTLHDQSCFSICDYVTPAVWKYLKRMFPDKSPWEV